MPYTARKATSVFSRVLSAAVRHSLSRANGADRNASAPKYAPTHIISRLHQEIAAARRVSTQENRV